GDLFLRQHLGARHHHRAGAVGAYTVCSATTRRAIGQARLQEFTERRDSVGAVHTGGVLARVPVGGDDLDLGVAVLSAAGADRFEGRQEAFELPCTAPYLGGLSTACTHSRPLLGGEQEECGIVLGGALGRASRRERG